MEIELSNKVIDAIAYKCALIVFRKLREADNKDLPEMVTTKQAAKILKISPDRMRKIADRFPHVKKGDAVRGQLLFVKEALLKNC